MPDYSQIFTLLFVMLGPFKMLGPFDKLTKNADKAFIRKISMRAILYSIITLALAAVLGDKIITSNSIPVPIVALSGGIILFLVSLFNVLQQFETEKPHEQGAGKPSPQLAIYPLTFPILVTPYGIAAVIVFTALSPDLRTKLTIGAMAVGIMVLNLIIMLVAQHFLKFLGVFLAILGAILSVLTLALGAKIIYNSLTALLKHA